MENFLFVLAFCAMVPSSLPVETTDFLIENEHVTVALQSLEDTGHFVSASYEMKTDKLRFVTSNPMHSILVYENEYLVFMLPVMADNVSLGKTLFGQKGSEARYKLAFNFEDQLDMVFADVKLK